MIVDLDNNVVSLNWNYANLDGSLGGKHILDQPYGTAPLTSVTEELAVSWLEDQLPNSTEEFNAELAARKERQDSLTPYKANPGEPPTPIVDPFEIDEEA
jgi:hypothetical protein